MQMKAIIIFVLVTLGMILGVGGLLWQFAANTDKPIADIAGSSHHTLGAGSVTVVEFSDFQCPACSAVQAPLEQILAKYPNKVQFIYRYFPLTTIHKNAQISAQAAEAAGMQGKFWELHNTLFTKQSEWENVADPRTLFAGYVKALGLNETQFLSDIDSQVVAEAIAVDAAAANRYNLSGTPTFFVNGIKTDFAQIDAKLAALTK